MDESTSGPAMFDPATYTNISRAGRDFWLLGSKHGCIRGMLVLLVVDLVLLVVAGARGVELWGLGIHNHHLLTVCNNGQHPDLHG